MPTSTAPASSSRCAATAVRCGNVVGVDARAVGGADARGVEEILDGEGATGERPGKRLAGLDARDERVPGVVAHEGTTATHSISTFAPSTAEPRHLDERARRPRVAEDLLPHGIDPRPVFDIRQEDRDLDDVGEPAAGGGEDVAHVPEDLSRLLDDVVSADETSLAVHRDDAGDEDQLA